MLSQNRCTMADNYGLAVVSMAFELIIPIGLPWMTSLD